MPELPEVETVSHGLKNHIIGKKITSAAVSDKRLRFEYPKDFISNIEKQEILSVSRRARYILIKLSNGKTLLVHLGMSGKLTYNSSPQDSKKHDHCFINFEDQSSLIYNDPRRFGVIDLIEKGEEKNHKMIKNLGPEPLSDDFTAHYLQEQLKNKKMNIKTAMMDNKIVVGVGNIYINESLFKSKVSPLRLSASLKIKELELLVKNIKNILAKAIKAGGSTLRDYVNLEGDVGNFQFDFEVYGKNNQECSICSGLIKRIKQNGRSSFYCSKCQK